MFVTKSGKVIDEDWREDVELCGFGLSNLHQ